MCGRKAFFDTVLSAFGPSVFGKGATGPPAVGPAMPLRKRVRRGILVLRWPLTPLPLSVRNVRYQCLDKGTWMLTVFFSSFFLS